VALTEAAQYELAKATVSRWAVGEAAPSPRFIGRLAEVLSVDPSELCVVTETARNLAYLPQLIATVATPAEGGATD
jgi:hypothetical protein